MGSAKALKMGIKLESLRAQLHCTNYKAIATFFKIYVWRFFCPYYNSFPVAQLVEHGVSNAKIMGSIPRESKS